ncbi:hypothetical protein UlMin_021942 [Ulmus minor]
MPRLSIYDSSEPEGVDDCRRLEQESDSCSSTSIGRNSDLSDGSSIGDDSGDDEVQSSYKGPLDTMDALQEVLPIKRGISSFYSGKSKSFTSLADATSVSSVKDLAKPENPYTRKRKNLIARTNLLEKNRNNPLKHNALETSKKPTNFNRSSFLLGEASSSSGDSNFSSPPSSLPPLHPQGRRSSIMEPSSPPSPRQSPWRSFSLSDLQSVAGSTQHY